MTRHGKNCTAGSVYTYHERKKDSEQSGFGSKEIRFGKDSVQEFDCCCLSLQPCRNPVVTPDGYLYDKECIIENILHQKKEYARKMKEFEKQKHKQKREVDELEQAAQEGRVKKFLESQTGMGDKKNGKDQPSTSGVKSVSNLTDGNDKKLPAFWLPSLTPDAKEKLVKKPDEKVRCPMSGKSLKLKDLLDVNFTKIQDGDDKKSLITKDARYVCAVTNDVLGNSVPVAVLKTSGSVVTMECVEKLIRKEMLDPINGKKLREKDIIQLQRGASGFAGSGIELKGKKDGPAILA